jgi:integrase
MATKRQRNGSWQYTIRRAGILPRPIYLTFDTEKEGDAKVARLEIMLDRGIVPDELRAKSKETVGAAITSYLASAPVGPDDRMILDRYAHELREQRLSDVGYRWAEHLVDALKAERKAPGTIRHHIGAMARCLDWACRRGDLGTNPLRLLPRGYSAYQSNDPGRRVDVERDRRLQPGEEDAIRAVLAGGYVPAHRQRQLALEHREAMTLLFDLALETAMRLSEMTQLTLDRIDLARRTIYLERTKSGRRRQVPLTSVAAASIAGYLEAGLQAGDRLFPWHVADGDGATSRAAITSKLSRAWGRVFDHAGVPDLRFHDLRHEATSRLFERTSLSDLEIAKITGHADPRMLARYANLRASHLAGKLW